jgi:hypothetical protein
MILHKFSISRDITYKGIITRITKRGDITFAVNEKVHVLIWDGIYEKIELQTGNMKVGIMNEII